MFDAKSLFEMMVRGGQPAGQGGQASGAGQQGREMSDLGDLLRQFTGQQGGGANEVGGRQSEQGGGNALEDLLRQFTEGRGGAVGAGNAGGASGSGGGGALDDLMRQFTQDRSGGGAVDPNDGGLGQGMRELPNAAPGAGSGPGAAGGLGDILGQVFGQGGDRAPGDTGHGGPADRSGGSAEAPGIRDLLEKLGGSGAQSGDLVRQLTDFIGNNKVGTGAALGGLGALIFGTRTGRSIAAGAAKVGALALVGGLAYKAYQNYSQGQNYSQDHSSAAQNVQPEAAPPGTGFEAEEVSNDAAATYIRGMIAAAASDGRIDASEQQKIIGSLKDQGLDARAEEFLAHELNNPAQISDLVGGVSNQTEALQLYTAARVSIDLDTGAEQQFLADLANQLGITPDLRAHVDQLSRRVAV